MAELRARLERLQLSQIAHGQRTMILVEGWEGSGRLAALRLLAGTLNPCRLSVHGSGEAADSDGRHWLAPYWAMLPKSGDTAAFLRGWYGRLIDRRVEGALGDKDWARAFDEVNEFEAQQTDHGTLIVKLFMHIGEQEQARRLNERLSDPWTRATLAEGGGRSLSARKSYRDAYDAMFKRSNTRWAGWNVIDAGNHEAGLIAALAVIVDALAEAVPNSPPKSKPAIGMASA